MKEIDIYNNYIVQIKEALENNNIEALDFILESITTQLGENDLEFLSDLVSEVTLYVELKDDEYKDEALAIISEIEEEIK